MSATTRTGAGPEPRRRLDQLHARTPASEPPHRPGTSHLMSLSAESIGGMPLKSLPTEPERPECWVGAHVPAGAWGAVCLRSMCRGLRRARCPRSTRPRGQTHGRDCVCRAGGMLFSPRGASAAETGPPAQWLPRSSAPRLGGGDACLPGLL